MKTFFTSLRTLVDAPVLGLLVLLFWLSMGNAAAQTITTGNITPTRYCAGAAIAIPFTVAGTLVSPGPTNITYRAQLSNAAGGFDSGTTNLAAIVTTVGSEGAANLSLTINTTVPAGLPISGQYRIRVQKILPGANVDGTPNTTDLQFGLIITADYPNPIGPYCVGNQISVSYLLNCDAPSGNVFSLQLSDAAGSFASPTIIASVNATGIGSISGNFPDVPTGNGYQMRIVSSNPSNPTYASEVSNRSLPFRISSGILTTMKANGSIYCPGEALNLNYAFNANEVINEGNIYSIELSNNNYASHTTLGTLASTAKSGSIQVAIPTNLIPNPNYPDYEIRVRASNSPIDGCEYGLYTIRAASTATLGTTNSPICAGSNATFTVSGTNGATLTYTLTGVSGNQTLLLNGSNQTITANNASTDVTLTLVSVSKDNCSLTLGTTSTVLVNPTPNAVATPSSQTICSAGAINTIVLSGNVANTTYNWMRDNSATVTGIADSGSGNISGSLTNTTNAPITVTFTITPTANNCPGTPITATVLVNPTPNAVATPSSQTICSAGAINTIVLSGNVANTTYNWMRDNTGTVTGIADSGSGNISGSLTNTTNAPITVTFTITPTANNCPGTSITATVLVNPTPNAVATPSSQTICSTSAINTIVLSGNVANTTYNWMRDNSATVTGIADSGSGNISGSLTNTTNAPITVTFTITPTANNCPGTSITATVLVNPTPNAVATPSSKTICSAGAINTIVLSGNVANTTYNWMRDNSATVTGIADSGSGNISGSLTNTTNAPITVTFTVTPTANNCPGTPITATVLVNPTPNAVATPSSQTICSAGAINTIVLSGNVANTTYNWMRDNSATVTGIADSGSGNISGSLTNTTNAPITVTFTITPTANNCPGTSITATVLVNPTPNAVATPSSQTICSAGAINTIVLSGNVANTTYNWTRDNSATVTGIADSGSGNISGSLTNTTNAPITVTFTITPTANNCPGTPITATVLVNPTPNAVATPSGQTICSTSAINTIVLSGNVANTTYNWMRDNSATVTGIADSGSGNISGSLTNTTNAPITVTFTITPTANNCPGTSITATVLVNPLPMAMISGATTVCQNSPSPSIIFTGANGTAPYAFTYKINGGPVQMASTNVGSNSVTVPVPTTTVGEFTYTLLSVSESSSTSCSQVQSGSVVVKVQGKPTITLSTLQQTLNEGNSQTFCDTDANPVNSLQFTVSGLCVVGSPVWRVQVGNGAWSDWSPNPPVSQSSNNQVHRYQAACDANCSVTYTTPIELTINYRSTVPQNVSLLVDGVTVVVGESKEVCSLVTIPLTFNANCAVGEITLYSVDGGEYSSGVPTGLVDNQYHNYRVRCRKSDGTPSCVESESGVMRLKLVTIPSAPTVSLSSTSSCDATASFSGQSSCGSLRTVWYNASTNVALPNLPSVVPSQTTSYYARCQTENGCVSEKSNVVTFTLTSTQVAPVITASQEIVCTGTSVTISANCPAGSQTFWNTGVTTPSFEVAFNNVTKQTYWAKCIFVGGCQSSESVRKDIYWNAFVVTLINVGESKSSVKTNDRAAWASQFITRDGGPELEQSTQQNPTLYFVENANKVAPRYWTINVETCGLSMDGSLTFDMLATPEMGMIRSFNTHENNAPYFMYANREGWTELYAQNHPAYGFYQDNGAGGNAYDAGLPKGLYKLGVRYWDQKGWGSIYPSTRKPQGNVLAYQEYWFRIQSKDGVGVGAARTAESSGQGVLVPPLGRYAARARGLAVLPNPVTNILRLQVQDSKGQSVQTTLTDASGRQVLDRRFVPETNTHQEEFVVSELPTGMYFLKVTTSEQQATLKVVKVQ